MTKNRHRNRYIAKNRHTEIGTLLRIDTRKKKFQWQKKFLQLNYGYLIYMENPAF